MVDIARVRAGMLAEAEGYSCEDVSRVVDVDAGGVDARLYLPDGATRAILYLHGGGFVYGGRGVHDAQARRLALRTGSAVLAAYYRRAPEHPFPAAVHDALAAADWLAASAGEWGLSASRLVALGDSAGANLAQVATLRRPGVFGAQVLAYPFLDRAGRTYDPVVDSPGLSVQEAEWYWRQYAPGPVPADDADLDPLRVRDLTGQPPTLIQLAELDILAATGRELGRRLAAGGVPVEVLTYPGVPHGFWRRTEEHPEAEQALRDIASFLDRTAR